MKGLRDRDLDWLNHGIIADTGERVIQQVRRLVDADDSLRLYESELEALQKWDRVVVRTEMGRKVVVEKMPDDPDYSPVEVRPADDNEARA